MIEGIKTYAKVRRQEEIDSRVYSYISESSKISDIFLEADGVSTEHDIFVNESGCKVVKEDSEDEAIDRLIEQIPESEDVSGEELSSLIDDEEDISIGELDEMI